MSDQIAAAREIVDDVEYTRRDLYTIASLTSSLHIDGHRADLVIFKAARAHAAFEGRTYIEQQRHSAGNRTGDTAPSEARASSPMPR